MAERSAALRVLNAGWLRPVFFLVFLVVLWDGAIRLFGAEVLPRLRTGAMPIGPTRLKAVDRADPPRAAS